MPAAQLHVGHQIGDLSDRKLEWLATMGVEHVVANTTKETGIQNEDGTWNVQPIRDLIKRINGHGISLDVLNLGIEAQLFTRQRFPGLLLGRPSRDNDIAILTQNFRAAGEAGIPCVKYNCNIIGILRTERMTGRGGAQYSTFDASKWTDHSLTEAGQTTPEQLWDSATYLLEKIVPVGEEAGVKLACHPHDPALPENGLRGLHSILGSVAGMKRFVETVPSPMNGFNFCLGTVAESCKDPATEALEAIRYFGQQKKIFMVHFRNIKGGYLNFQEVYPDNGDMDFFKAVQIFQEVGYTGMLCPDHVPHSSADPDDERQFSFCIGYIKGLLNAAGSR